jgi:hypothetical protein
LLHPPLQADFLRESAYEWVNAHFPSFVVERLLFGGTSTGYQSKKNVSVDIFDFTNMFLNIYRKKNPDDF